MRMDREQIRKIRPHRPPMLLADTVEALEEGSHIVTRFHVAPDWRIFEGHFPGAPVLPGIYTVECMGQAADILLLSCARYAGTTPYLIGIDNIRFISKVAPGDMLEVHATISSERQEKGIVACTAEVYNLSANNQVCCTGEVILAMR